MQHCPHCNVEIRIRELPHPSFFANYRVCPNCSEKFTVDRNTKYRQAICIPLALTSLFFTGAMYFGHQNYLLPALLSYLVLAIYIYWANKRVYFVPYPPD